MKNGIADSRIKYGHREFGGLQMSRNKNVDVMRAVALLIVMIYHGWVLTGSVSFNYSGVTLLVALGGEIGVTAFFALSGYGIYHSLRGMEEKQGKINYKEFWLKRIKRIAPQYYLCIAVIVLFSKFFSSENFLSINGLRNIVTHLFFIHNLFPAYHGSMNGVLWTMGNIVQFYLIAPFLYKGFKKYGIRMEIGCILVTVLMKFVMYAYILPYTGHSNDLAFFSGRQLITALDNFTIGMYIAYVLKDRKTQIHGEEALFIGILSVVEIIVVCKVGMLCGIHTNNTSGYLWHSLLALGLGGILLSISYMKNNGKSIVYRVFLWLSKYEYEIYIWHLLILKKLLKYFSWTQEMMEIGYLRGAFYFIYLFISIAVGVGVSKGMNILKKKLSFKKV
jgi:peptidoglycan/LPS O-acetylase OafA/YrhL